MKIKGKDTASSLIALSRALAPLMGAGCGLAMATPAQAQSVCVPDLALGINCPPAPVLPTGPVTGPLTVTLGDGTVAPTTVALTTLGTAADVTLNAVGNAAINTVNQPGAVVNSAGAINAQVNSIATSGDGATGAVLRAVDGVLFTADDAITTIGNNAPGIDAQGSTVTVNGDLIQTQGNDSNGVQLVSLDGPINLNASAIQTNGDRSSATVLQSAGPANVNVGVLRTNGSQALGLDIATNPATCVLLGNGGCDVTAAADQITTNGFGGIGALVSAATGVTTVNVNALQTGGDQAAGLNLSANPTVCATLGAGACDQNFTVGNLTTTGANSPGALVRAAGNITGNVGVLTTNGQNAAGLDLASDPDACVLLGKGNCGTSFNVGQLTTSGAGATGVLARVVGPTTGRVNVLGTSGDNANGIDITGDPTACALLGSGACDVDLAANQVTTQGNGAAAVLINTPANVLANIGSIATAGDDATGLGITTDPAVCLVLGPGACGITATTTGPVTTTGNGSTGVDVNGGGDPTNVTTGSVSTSGDNSTGVDVTNDGPTTVTTGPVTTTGDNSPGVIVDGGTGPTQVTTTGPVSTSGDGSTGVGVTGTGPIGVTTGDVSTGGAGSPGIAVTGGDGAITVDYGNVTTAGDDSPGVGVTGTGPITVAGGGVTTRGARSTGVAVRGGAAPIAVTTGPIATSGDGSTGVAVTGTGPIGVTTGDVSTAGTNAPGIAVAGGDGPITVGYGNVTTAGDDSPGVDVTGTGPITVSGGAVTTAGTGSDGVTVAGGAGPVQVSTGPIATSGDTSDGIAVTTASGDQTIIAGPVATTGAGSNGITATSPGCSAINITATGPVSSAQGTGIAASSACRVAVTTRFAAPVSGRAAGIAVTSGTGSTVTIGDRVSSTAGPALDANGGAANVTITPTGTLAGRFDLTDADDTLTNNGRIEATGDSSFGGGNDSFVNNGTLAVLPGSSAPGAVTLAGLENMTNSGLIDMRNGHTGDTLTVPGNFTGTGGSTLAVDLSATPAGVSADRLIVGGAATGSTAIALNPLSPNNGVLVNGLVVVDAGPGSSATAFSLAPTSVGLVGYNLAFAPATDDYALYGTPNTAAYELLKASEGARQIFYRTDDTWSAHMQSLRDAGAGAGAGDDQRRGSALWGQIYGSTDKSRSRQDMTVFGQAQNVVLDNWQDFYGGQLGYDFGGISGGRGAIFGVTGGYASSTLGFRTDADRFEYDSVNGGAYAGFKAGPFFLNVLGKYEHYWVNAALPTAGVRRKFDGDSWGGKAEAGLRFGGSGFYAEPIVAVEYVRTNLNDLAVGATTIDFDRADGVRGSAGLRLGTDISSGTTRTSVYVSGTAVHEFEGRGGFAFENGGQSLGFTNDRIGTYGHGSVGVSIATGSRVSGFIEATGDWSDDYKGGGGRAGINVRF